MDFIPYGKQFIDEADFKAVAEALASPLITTGPIAKEFEKRLCEYTGAKYSIVVSNGTAALHLASIALLSADDKVLTTPNSFLATSNAILYANAKPIFVDIEENGNINLDLCEEAIKKDPTIKAIYAVAFSGNPVDQKKLKHIRDTYNVKILEDCAHAIGSEYDGIKAGSCVNSDCTIFSFHPVKHMTTGEGGAITTNNKDIYEKIMLLRNHGMERKHDIAPWYYEMTVLGFNYRITDIQCALGISQLDKLNENIVRRRILAQRYDNVFKRHEFIKPLYTYDGNSSYHLYVVKIDFNKLKVSKIGLFNKLKEYNFGVMVHYIPINKQPYYRELGYGDEDTPNMNKYYEETISLPMYYSLSDAEQDYVIKSLFEILK
ncbi:DegT/DnrJ/EryC1/StrS aminotransferase [Sulfurimonas gotlandica GD1]|uniref:UDP-4-amino-4,6-dideoxy-N-acetyl-beta-L-altrosamine transaminase n=1 Tax=Sulfurimonas gotlandica (strain DSM 19862 / JCM 16533 / GD1) TaxID=929558 RepID=B6BKJ5_SULGG|nr:UDP-4-amino-4,6-dideoxy-N-acetyl-beta-L-altrosamine transaminase [Sulfurimonas gotlandica]EDZ62370.1 Cys/Met metabolism pyridoxal-phosphate-dependent enzyme [Sulfurimonas gotlandica GD1]EHP29050.1 DegT/DnrJ/EryC1/StrS aminotransferase [Sulfurimonas gotlandica GD1]